MRKPKTDYSKWPEIKSGEDIWQDLEDAVGAVYTSLAKQEWVRVSDMKKIMKAKK